MNSQQIIDRARRLTHTNSTNYNDTDAVEDLNLIYQELVDAIVNEVDEDYFWDIGKTASVINQSEYVIEQLGISPNALDIKKVNKVFIKYSTDDTYFTRAKFLNPSSLELDTDWYEDNQPTSEPFFYFQDESVFIYPAPSEAITDAIKMYLIHVPADLTISSAQENIEIPFQFHKVISTGLKQYIYGSQGKINEKNDAINDFQREKDKMISDIKERYNQPGVSVMPNLIVYE